MNIDDKTNALADQVIEAAKTFMEKKLRDFAAALKLDERLRAIEAGDGASAGETIKSLERRLSRNSDHLNRVESRLQALETAGASPAPPPQLGHNDHVR